ncbi:hypothetical protein Q3G72_031351 [Acer saccharum]|nr:hypothetical protein Q3G72_016368 [Acer saccharum]KAK1584263.1 hypothetical protein Q3G72_031351 [Acer saccharum]
MEMEVYFALVLPYDRWSRSAIEVEDVEQEEDVLVQRSHWESRLSAAAETQMPMKMTAEINAMARLWMTGIESSRSSGFDGEQHVIVSCLIGLLHWAVAFLLKNKKEKKKIQACLCIEFISVNDNVKEAARDNAKETAPQIWEEVPLEEKMLLIRCSRFLKQRKLVRVRLHTGFLLCDQKLFVSQIIKNLLLGENDIKKGESGPEIGKQPSPKYEKGIGLHGPSNCVSKSPSTVKSFTDNMFLGDGVIKVQYGNNGMGRIIDIDGMNSTSGESSKEEFLSFSAEWEVYGEDNINQKMRKDKIFSLAIQCYGMKHRSSKFKILNMG